MAAGWSTVTLDKIIDVKHGYAFPGEHIRENPTRDILLTPGNFEIGGGFKAEKFKYYDGEVPEEYVLEEGDLLVTMTDLSKQSDTLGFPALIPKADGARFLHNQRVGRVLIKPNAGVDKRFLYYLLRSAEYRHEVLASATGTSIKHTSPSRILAYKANLPGLAVQRAIAHILGTLDDKIELNRKMNQTLEAMARAVFKSWFVDFDPVRAKAEGRDTGLSRDLAALFPDSFEDSELGKIPKGWRVQQLGDLIELAYGKAMKEENRQSGNVPVFGSNGQVGTHNEKLVTGPGIVVGRKGNPGIVTWAPSDFFPIDTTFYVVTRDTCRSLYFLFYALQDQNLASQGSDSAVPGLNRNMAYMGQLVAPNVPVLDAFDKMVKPIFEIINHNNEESHTLAALRNSFLPKLLSGEIRVMDA